jgi:hypothetical protein
LLCQSDHPHCYYFPYRANKICVVFVNLGGFVMRSRDQGMEIRKQAMKVWNFFVRSCPIVLGYLAGSFLCNGYFILFVGSFALAFFHADMLRRTRAFD